MIVSGILSGFSGLFPGLPTESGIRLVRAWPLVFSLAVLGGCAGLGADRPHIWYELRDLAAAGPEKELQEQDEGPDEELDKRLDKGPDKGPGTAAEDCVVLVTASAVNAFYETTSMVYRRQPGRLGLYQYAGWSELPSARIGRLLGNRLQAGGTFADVAPAPGLVQGRWLVEAGLETLLHDDVEPPGISRIGLRLRVIDRRRGRTIALRRFDDQEPLAEESAAAAADAFAVALTRVLDAAASWLPRQIGRRCASAVSPDTGSGRQIGTPALRPAERKEEGTGRPVIRGIATDSGPH